MRNFRWSCLLFALLSSAVSCNNYKQTHPQAKIGNSDTIINESMIRAYADSIDANRAHLRTKHSLIYIRGDYSFHVTQYLSKDMPVLYVKQGEDGEYGSIEDRYYLKNNQLVLHTLKRKAFQSKLPNSFRRDYIRNGITFYSEVKKAEDENALKTVPFTVLKTSTKDFTSDIATLNNAVNQTGKFNLVFDGITEYPKARYIILSRDELNAYRAPVLVEKEDEFIREIISNPKKYEGKKLSLNWSLRNGNEVVYHSGRIKTP